MKKRTGRSISLYMATSAALLLIVLLWGCPKKPDDAGMTAPTGAATEPAPQADEAAARQEAAQQGERQDDAPGLQPVYFDFDRADIRDDAREVMRANADWLKANPAATVRIEGNCDERGTIEYNQALGQRRAAAAKRYLADLGISPGRVSLISYGKEKPVCADSSENCWQKNRRDEFVADGK